MTEPNEIATLPPLEELQPGVTRSPRTGEPRRPAALGAAAVVLYLLASASVRGFAFTLGLTTLLDILLVFTFTHPLVAVLSRRKFFRDGHPWSGLDPRRLGVQRSRYLGRGRFGGPSSQQPLGDGSAS